MFDALKNFGQEVVNRVKMIPQVFSTFGEAAKAKEQAQRVAQQLGQVKSAQQPQIQQPPTQQAQVSPEVASSLIGVDKSQVQIPQIKLEVPKVNTNLTSGGIVNLPNVSTKVETSAPTIKEIENLINQKIQEKIPPVIATPVPPSPTQDVSRQEWKNILDKYGVTQTLTKLETLANTINAANQAFDEVLAEKQKEPAMNASFKQKMMNFLIEGRDKNIKSLQAQYDALKDALNTRLSLAKDELGVYERGLTRVSTERERAIDNMRQLIQQFISSGAMGNVDDDTLRSWSSVLGVGIKDLKDLRKAVKTNNDLKIQNILATINRKLKQPQGNILTIQESKKLGLPLSLVGRSEAEVAQEITSPTPPIWFKQMIQEKMKQSLLPDELVKKWDEFKKNFASLKLTGGINQSDLEALINAF
jgi:hypothetical protein